jgi:signal transduction histidine kinase
VSTAPPAQLERPRAFRREGILRRIYPFAATGLTAIALAPFVINDVDQVLVTAAFAIDAVLVVVVLATPWPRLPRWAETVPPMLGFGIVGLLVAATGGGSSVLSALGFLIVFWFALNGTERDVQLACALFFLALAAPLLLSGDTDPPLEELARAVLWSVLGLVIGIAAQRAVESSWRAALQAQHLADLRARVNEELRAAEELQSQFVAMVSHELRTPLTSIRGFANTIDFHYDDLGDDERRHFARIIEEQAARLSRLVEHLLALSRIEAGTMSSDVEAVDVGEVVELAVAQFGHVDIEVRCPPRLLALADPDHVQQIVVNYLANATRYGAPPFVVTAGRVGSSAQIVVVDAGPGVEPEFVPRLFERFTQASDQRDALGSTGLGLSIVRGLAHSAGGDAWYEPAPDGGTCFVVSLPLAESGGLDDEDPTPQVALLDY